MKLVESDIPDSVVPPHLPAPRAPKRRVAVSLALTISLLAAMVATVYVVFPRRDNEVLAIAIRRHQSAGDYDLTKPSAGEVRAWTLGVLRTKVPWPALDTVEPLGVRTLQIFRRPAAEVRVVAGGQEVSLFALRARDAPPRKLRKVVDEQVAISWRHKKWTLVAVGPSESEDVWRAVLGQ